MCWAFTCCRFLSTTATETRRERLYTTFLASSFRTLRFGLHGSARQRDGAAVQLPDGQGRVRSSRRCWEVDATKIKGAVRDLAHDLLTIEATGDYAGAKRCSDTLGRDAAGYRRHDRAHEQPAGRYSPDVRNSRRPRSRAEQRIDPHAMYYSPFLPSRAAQSSYRAGCLNAMWGRQFCLQPPFRRLLPGAVYVI